MMILLTKEKPYNNIIKQFLFKLLKEYTMRKTIAVWVIMLAMVFLFTSCAKKKPVVAPTPEPVSVEVEDVDKKVEKPALTEEEIFQQKTVEELNKAAHLKRINFDFDRFFVREDMKPILQANADWLRRFPTVEIVIEGHCDERGTVEYNMALGEKRAQSARNYLVSLGIPANRVKTVSYGKNRPLVPGVDEASYFQNRRAEFVITKK